MKIEEERKLHGPQVIMGHTDAEHVTWGNVLNCLGVQKSKYILSAIMLEKARRSVLRYVHSAKRGLRWHVIHYRV